MIFLSSNLRYLRESKGLTQGQLAEMIGVKPNTISNYETGNSSPDFELLGLLVGILDTDAHALLYTDMRGAENPLRVVSDVRAPYGENPEKPAEKQDVAADIQGFLAGYETRLENMSRDIEQLKEIVSRLPDNKKP